MSARQFSAGYVDRFSLFLPSWFPYSNTPTQPAADRWLPEAFYQSAEVFARKWSHRLPVATPCVIIDRGGEVRVLGNAVTRGPRSIAYALPGHPRALLSGEIIVQGTDGSARSA